MERWEHLSDNVSGVFVCERKRERARERLSLFEWMCRGV
jgi:hypothetical protein